MQSTQALLYNRYSILHIERTNSFNKVFFVLDTYQNPPRSCVIKVFQPIAEKPRIIKWIERNFRKEASRLKQLSQANQYLPEIYTYFNDSKSYYIVRELIEGKTLYEKVQTIGILPVREVKEILVKLLSVLDYLHKQKVVHQNIKPKNIILRSDRVPMLINFGSIKQIVSTYGFHGDKHIFSSNNSYGYAPSEQAFGRSVPATDIYSLGLTAIYLLTAKNPVDLSVKANSSNFQVPDTIASLDSKLAMILTRAISHNLSDRYTSAREMLDDLLQKKSPARQPVEKAIKPVTIPRNHVIQPRNWWKTLVYILSGLYIIGTAIIVWYDWNLNQNTYVPQLPEPSTLLPGASPKAFVDKPSMLNNQGKDLVEIPILSVGTSKEQLKEVLGKPNAIQQGYWDNSNAWIYKNRANGLISMGFLFDLDTDKLQQTEVAIAPTVGLATIEDILDSLLQGNITPSVKQQLQQVYQRQTEEYSFSLENLEGSIKRESNDRIYLGVWQANFH